MLFALLLIVTPVQAAPFDVECVYTSRSQKELVEAADCARRGGTLDFNPARVRDFAFKHGLSDVNVGGQWHYVRRDGRSQPVMTFENWADEFHDNRARSEADGKIGYVDHRLRLVLPRFYDGAFPFDRGRALVCFGCTRQSDGEHSFYTGGEWTCIDPRGRELQPRRRVQPGDYAKFTCGYAD